MLPEIIDERRDDGTTYRHVINEVNSQRNGVAGEGFYVVKFSYMEVSGEEIIGMREELIAVLFHDAERTAVIDPNDLNSHWRGDMFASTLREAVSAHLGFDAWQ